MPNTYRIVLAVLACVAIAVAAPQKGKMKDPRDGKTYKTMTFHKSGSEPLIWMTEPLGGDSSQYMYKDAKNACPNGWRLPTMMESLFLIDILEGEKTEVNPSLFKFSMVPQKVKFFNPQCISTFFTSDGYYVSSIPDDFEKIKKCEMIVWNLDDLMRMTKQLISGFDKNSAEITPESIAQAVDEYRAQVRCVKRVETQKK
jgi:uncharacterized protein (TIGR02145 family)